MNRLLAAALALTTLTLVPRDALAGQDPATTAEPAAIGVDDALEQARSLKRDGRYEEVIDVLEPLLQQIRPDPEHLRETYLLLIESHVLIANEFDPNARARDGMVNLARQLVHECLSTPALRHTRPDELGPVPKEMSDLFDDVRREIFGTLWITSLDPSDAEVTLDGERVLPDDNGDLKETDLPVGVHLVVLRHPDRRDTTEEIEIAPAQVLSKEYALPKKKGAWWYVSRIGVPVAAAAAVVIAVVSGDEEQAPADEPLPGPPDPPTKRP